MPNIFKTKDRISPNTESLQMQQVITKKNYDTQQISKNLKYSMTESLPTVKKRNFKILKVPNHKKSPNIDNLKKLNLHKLKSQN